MLNVIGLRFIVLREQEDPAKDADFHALPPGPKMAWFMASSAAASAGDATRLVGAWTHRAEAASLLGLTTSDFEEAVRLGYLQVEGHDLRIVGTGRVIDRATLGGANE